VNGKPKFGIGGIVSDFKRENRTVTVELKCHAEEDSRIKQDWGFATSKGSVSDVKDEKNFFGALDDLAYAFAPQVVSKFKGSFTDCPGDYLRTAVSPARGR